MSQLMEIFNSEQPLISVLFVLQLLGLGTVMLISFERFYRFRRAKIDLKSFLQGIFNVLQTNKVMEAVSICDKFSTPVSEVVRAMVLSPESENAVLAKEAAGNVGEVEIGRYELGLRTLAALRPDPGALHIYREKTDSDGLQRLQESFRKIQIFQGRHAYVSAMISYLSSRSIPDSDFFNFF